MWFYLAMELFKYDIFTCTPKCPIRAMANAFIGYNILIQSSQWAPDLRPQVQRPLIFQFLFRFNQINSRIWFGPVNLNFHFKDCWLAVSHSFMTIKHLVFIYIYKSFRESFFIMHWKLGIPLINKIFQLTLINSWLSFAIDSHWLIQI